MYSAIFYLICFFSFSIDNRVCFFPCVSFTRYDHGRLERHNECGYNQNEGYVVFSAMGSFFIPMAVMVYVYVRISCVVASRHDHMTEIEVHKVINFIFFYMIVFSCRFILSVHRPKSIIIFCIICNHDI